MTIYEYMKKTGRLSFKEEKINEIDYALFSFLSYADYTKIFKGEELIEVQRNFDEQEKYETAFSVFLAEKQKIAYEDMKQECQKEKESIYRKYEELKEKLFELRSDYLKKYPNRNFELTKESNEQYQKLYDDLNCESLGEYKKRAAQQAKTAVLHFC